MAKTYRCYLPEQDLLLPSSLREWLPENHLAYFVSDLIDQVDLSAIEAYYDSGVRLLRGNVLVAATAEAVAGGRGVSGVGGGQRARLPHDLGVIARFIWRRWKGCFGRCYGWRWSWGR